MRRIITSRDDWSTILVEDIEIEQPVGPVVDQQPRDEKPKQEDPPTENQDVTPVEEKADAGAPEVEGEGEGTDEEADTQERAKPIIGPESGDDPDVVGHTYGHPEPIKMPETGEGKPPI